MNSPDTAEPVFNEAWYLSQNPDVAFSVENGGWKSGLEHYLMHGLAEGRSPAPPDEPDFRARAAKHNGPHFLAPSDLSVTPTKLRRIAMVGSCMMGAWELNKSNPLNCPVDMIVMNNAAELPERPGEGQSIDQYDFQVVQIPLRTIFHDTLLSRLSYQDIDAHTKAFDDCCQKLEFQLRTRMRWNIEHGLLTFVSNFLTPQQNTSGILFPRFDLRNHGYFIDKLNEYLEKLIGKYKNSYILDMDQISTSLGKRYLQDDIITATSHNSLIGAAEPKTHRIEFMAAMSDHYEIHMYGTFRESIWNEIIRMYRAVRQFDSVKLVIVDLDDTLWNGVSGDMPEVGPEMLEGWPIGLAEALLYLKKRGILLAIASKNEESRIRDIWPKIFHNRLKLEDFAVIKINWRPKVENIREILSLTNLLSRNAVFVDDNPVEREAALSAFPDLRILGRHPYYLRRILLWSSETQVAQLTDESSRRTEMMQAQVVRESNRGALTREEFLKSAAPIVTVSVIDNTNSANFPRASELINKTNQFNTTGRRWKYEDFESFLSAGGRIFTFKVSDSYTDYGLVGAITVQNNMIEQWVMSCRILGYDIEKAVMSILVAGMRAEGHNEIDARLEFTDVNFPCRDLYSKCDFKLLENVWKLDENAQLRIPDHVKIAVEQ